MRQPIWRKLFDANLSGSLASASIPLVITMSVVVFIVHGDDPFRQQELPLLFGLAFLALLFTGPGKLSLDALISKRS